MAGRAKSQGDNVTELPDGAADATGLTPRQQRVLATIKDSIEKRGYPPSMREIGEAVGLTSLLLASPTSCACWRRRASSSATPTGRVRSRCSCPRCWPRAARSARPRSRPTTRPASATR